MLLCYAPLGSCLSRFLYSYLKLELTQLQVVKLMQLKMLKWFLQVFRVAKSISHHARFRSTMVSGGGRLRPQEDSLNNPIDMVVGTPGRILQHIEDGNMVYGDIKYLVSTSGALP